MTPEQFRAALDRLGLSQVGFAHIADVSVQTVWRWATGRSPIPRVVEMAMSTLHPPQSPATSDAPREEPK